MENFDWIQWYFIGLQILGLVCTLILDGKPKTGEHSMKWWVISSVVGLPIYGRMVGWW